MLVCVLEDLFIQTVHVLDMETLKIRVIAGFIFVL